MKKKFNGWLAAEIVALIVLIGCLGIIVMRTVRQMQYNDIRTETYEEWYVAQKEAALKDSSATAEPTPTQTPEPTTKSTSTPEPTSTATSASPSATPKAA